MKIQGELFEIMFEAIQDGCKDCENEIKKRFLENPIKTMWLVWPAVAFQLMNDDTHPAFIKGYKRTVKYRPGFNVYNYGVNDKHIESALKKIFNILFAERNIS